MLSDEIRRRLEALNRQPLPAPAISVESLTPPPSGSPFLRFDQGTPLRRLDPVARSSFESRATVPLAPPARDACLNTIESLVAGEEVENASGKHYRIRRSLARFWPQGARAIAAQVEDWDGAIESAAPHFELAAFARHFPRGVLFLDLETCGFAGSMVFLIGLVWHSGDELALDQLLARNYAEERAILETLWQVAARNEVLVTFNGKSFDWPMVHDRSTRHHLGRPQRGGSASQTQEPASGLGPRDPRPRLLHCDALHHARRRWRTQLPNCKLQTLEAHLCRRFRRGDIPGAEIPLAYHQYVRTGDARKLQSILHHNALDLLTLVEVMLKIVEPSAEVRDASA